MFDRWPAYCLERFRNEVKHETMHMVQYLMGVYYDMCDDWFMEGIAEYISGGAHPPISTVEQLESWRTHPDHDVHPIDICSWEDFPPPYLRTSGGYYPMFHLAVEYLLDENGYGKKYSDVKHLFEDRVISTSFRSSFNKAMGMTTIYYKENFYDLIIEYLKRKN